MAVDTHIYRVTTLFSGASVVGGAITRMYFSITGGTPQQAATATTTFWTGARQVIDDSITIAVQSQVEQLDPVDGNIVAANPVTGSSQIGLDDGATLPYQTQGLVQLRTGDFVDGREVRGRIYLPAPSISSFSNGVWASGRLATVNAAAAALIADANSELVVWQREREANSGVNHDLPHRDGGQYLVTTALLWSKTAVLRSRRD